MIKRAVCGPEPGQAPASFGGCQREHLAFHPLPQVPDRHPALARLPLLDLAAHLPQAVPQLDQPPWHGRRVGRVSRIGSHVDA